MALLPENVLVVYRSDSADSLEFAQYYGALYNLDSSQLVGVPCSGEEILASYDDFLEQIESPLLEIISSEYNVQVLKCIIVGYGVPGGFYDGTDIIATTSRLSRIHYGFDKQLSNPLFARTTYQDYSIEDASQVYITSRFDLPTLETAKKAVDNAKVIVRQSTVNGGFFFDKDTLIEYQDDSEYEVELADFESLLLPSLNIPIVTTFHWDDNTDVPLFRLNNDSFVWAWKSDRAGYTFFDTSRPARVFCYNADLDGAETLRDADDRRWPMLALSSGYAATAGSMSDPTPSGYLRPMPFFYSLLKGSTIGEAFLFALPYLNWTVTLLGDPLVKVKFPRGAILSEGISQLGGISQMGEHLANSIAFMLNRKAQYQDIFNAIDEEKQDISVKVDLWLDTLNALTTVDSTLYPDFSNLSQSYIALPKNPNLDTLLYNKEQTISSLITTAAEDTSLGQLSEEGSWKVEALIIRSGVEFFTYQFELQIAYDAEFTDMVLTSYSPTDPDKWYYEQFQDRFELLPINGVTANYSGRRVRFIPSTLIPRATILYARIRQVNNFLETTPWVIQTLVVNT